jgi:ACS family hexuronate transporter-like MFS transporter
MLFPLLVGSMLDHYKELGDVNVGYNILFIICGFAYLLAWGIMHFFAPKMEQVAIDDKDAVVPSARQTV